MHQKWLVFTVSAALSVALGLLVAPRFTRAADDEKETPLGKIMEKVNKADATIRKYTRNAVAFKKNRQDVEKSAKEIVKLATEVKLAKEVELAKLIKDTMKKAKAVADPAKKWDEYIDELVKSSAKLGEITAGANAAYPAAKGAYNAVKKVCSDCHTDFRVEEEGKF
jgi:chromosome segregation ATPase